MLDGWQPQLALRHLKRSVDLRPQLVPALSLAGVACLRCRRPADAVAYLQRAVEGAPEKRRVFVAYLNALLVQAIRLFREGDLTMAGRILQFILCPPFIIGHEFVGIVEEAGNAVKTLRPGDRVAVSCYPYCGICDNCRNGLTGWCLNSAVFGSGESFGNLPGGLAELVRVPHVDSCLVKIPDEMSDEQAIFVGDMFATGYFGAYNCSLKPGDTVAVLGAGPVGLCAVHLARLYSPSKIILIGRRSNRLQTGLKMGATHITQFAQKTDLNRESLEMAFPERRRSNLRIIPSYVEIAWVF